MLSIIMSGDFNPNAISDLATEAVKNAKLNKAQWLIFLVFVTLLAFIILYSFVPAVHSKVPLTSSDIRVAFWIDVGMGIVLCILYSVPEIIKKFKNIKNPG